MTLTLERVTKGLGDGKKLRPRDVSALRKKLRLSQEGFGRLLDVTGRTVARWEAGEVDPETALVRKVRGLESVVLELGKAADPDAIVRWLSRPAKEFDGHAPADLLASEWATKQLLARIEDWDEDV